MTERVGTTGDVSSRFLVVNTPKSATEVDRDAVAGHLAFLAAHHGDGTVTMSGPFPGGGGAYVLRAPSVEAAWSVVLSDPLYQSSDFLVRQWSVPAGDAGP